MLLIRGAAVGAADGIDAHGQVFQPQLAQQFHHQHDQLRVRRGLGRAEALHAELMMLPEPPGLGGFIAEVGRVDIVHFHGQRLSVQAAFQKCAHRARRAFRLQGHAAVALILKGIHLLAHYVAAFAGRAGEQLRMLQNRGTDLPVSSQQCRLAAFLLYRAPTGAFRGQHVLHSLRDLRQHFLHLIPIPRHAQIKKIIHIPFPACQPGEAGAPLNFAAIRSLTPPSSENRVKYCSNSRLSSPVVLP